MPEIAKLQEELAAYAEALDRRAWKALMFFSVYGGPPLAVEYSRMPRPKGAQPSYAGGAATVAGIDAFVASLGGGDYDAAALEAPRTPQAPLTGERRLAYEMVMLAFKDATKRPRNGAEERDQRSARSWLCNEAWVFSARACFETLLPDVDYDVIRKRLLAAWAKHDAQG